MPIPPLTWFIHTVTRASRISVDVNGEPVLSAQSTFRCRIEKRTVYRRGADGKDASGQHQLVTVTPIKIDDVFWFPAIFGEPADDVTDPQAGRTPVQTDIATTMRGTAGLYTFSFP